MEHINIYCIGKIKETYLKEAINEYSKRLSKYCLLNIYEFPDKNIPDKLNESIENQIIEFESNEILKHLNKNEYNICLDLSGNNYTSVDFAKHMQELQMTNSTINFIIGGSLGLSNEIKNFSNEKICFSKMTFPHQLIRVFLLEQIFRSFKINNNEKYHH